MNAVTPASWRPPERREVSPRVALVTGANRGIGREVARQLGQLGLRVLLGVRDYPRGEAVARELADQGLQATALQLDVTRTDQVVAAAALVKCEFGRLDVLINNAGGYYDPAEQPSDADLVTVAGALDTHLLGAWRLCEMAVPMMRAQGYGRIVNVSSACGASGAPGEQCTAYRVSKGALNHYTRLLAGELAGSGVLVNAVCPGWTDTGLGGVGGRPVADAARGIVWAAQLPGNGPHGGFFRDGKPLAW